ncbi:hypothetical protein BDM02DRAFT_3192825 [Thelephora ganbajun]|uniref:Uncharacterized protein n=1 Tax=Thelephora ganbajun TaxID=370292 RepID=A0ACB6YZG7_THEGA|nr:hypothetical protein BDM02DRAFT_3192825 [Thelephora ganbajun]
MKRLFGKKSKKSPKPSPKHKPLGIPAKITAGLLGFRAKLDTGPDGEQIRPYHPEVDRHDLMMTLSEGSNRGSRIVLQDNSGEDKEPPAPEVSTSGVADVGTDHRSDPTRENATDTGEEEGGGKLAETSKEGEYKDTALRAATILPDVPKEAAGGFGSLKAVLRVIAVHANNQGTIAIGNGIETLLSRIVALEELFYSRPGDVEEQRRRDKLIRTAAVSV